MEMSNEQREIFKSVLGECLVNCVVDWSDIEKRIKDLQYDAERLKPLVERQANSEGAVILASISETARQMKNCVEMRKDSLKKLRDIIREALA